MRCTRSSAARNSDLHAAPLQLRAQAGEQRHRSAIDALHGGHLEVEGFAARRAGLEPPQLGPELRRLGEPEIAAEANIALPGSGLDVLDGEGGRHPDDLSEAVGMRWQNKVRQGRNPWRTYPHSASYGAGMDTVFASMVT